MAIDLDLFHFQLADLNTARLHLESSVSVLKRNGNLKGVFGLFTASSGIPGPPDEEALNPEPRTEARTERRLREMLARMSYVFGVTCLDHLLLQCVEETLRTQPQRLVGKGSPRRETELIRRQIVDGWSRDRVIEELIASAVRTFERLPFYRVSDYFHDRLGVLWEPDWREDLLRIVETRNRAAHALNFVAPSHGQIDTDIEIVMAHGESIVRAVAEKHGIPLNSATIDRERAEAGAE